MGNARIVVFFASTAVAFASVSVHGVESTPAPAQIGPAVTGVFFSSRPVSGGAYRAGELIQVVLTFDEPVTVTGAPRLALIIGGRTRHAAFDSVAVTEGVFGGSYLYFNYRVQLSDRDADGIGVPAAGLTLKGGTIRGARGADAVLDLVGRAVAGASPEHRVDGRGHREPSVVDVSVRSRPQRGNTYGRGERIRVGVRFSGDVTVSGAPRLALTMDGATREASHGSGSGVPWLWFHYDVLAVDRDADGIGIARHALRLNGGTIRDARGVDAVLDIGRYAFAGHAGHRVDGAAGRAPAVTEVFFDSAPLGGDTYEHGEEVSVRVFFDKIVAVAGEPALVLTVGTGTRTAAFNGLSWSNTEGWSALRFRYYVDAADRDPDGIGVAVDALRLNGGTIRDAGGADAALRLDDHAFAAAPAHKVDGSVDTTTPVVTDAFFDSEPSGGEAYGAGDRIRAVVRLSEPVSVAGEPRLALEIGGRLRMAAFEFVARSTDNATLLYFGYTVQATDHDADGMGIATDALRLNGGAIRDLAGNDARLDLGRHTVAAAAGQAVVVGAEPDAGQSRR